MFPFHQGRFQGSGRCGLRHGQDGFPFHQGRFQGLLAELAAVKYKCFHSTKEGFKAGGAWPWPTIRTCFHSTKEGFKVKMLGSTFPIDQSFHSTKEGFKGHEGRQHGAANRQFPFHQGRFQGPRPSYHRSPWMPRFPFHQGRFQGRRWQNYTSRSATRFHSTKEGFKGNIGTASRWSTSSFHSTKEGFKVGPRSNMPRPTLGSFHSTKEGFKATNVTSVVEPVRVSIPPRKVSRDEW